VDQKDLPQQPLDMNTLPREMPTEIDKKLDTQQQNQLADNNTFATPFDKALALPLQPGAEYALMAERQGQY
jgi:hypothetical protein